MARHANGRKAIGGMLLTGALLAGGVGLAGAANAAPVTGSVSAGLMGPAPLFPPPPPPPWHPHW